MSRVSRWLGPGGGGIPGFAIRTTGRSVRDLSDNELMGEAQATWFDLARLLLAAPDGLPEEGLEFLRELAPVLPAAKNLSPEDQALIRHAKQCLLSKSLPQDDPDTSGSPLRKKGNGDGDQLIKNQ